MTTDAYASYPTLTLNGEMRPAWRPLFTPQALGFVAELHKRFDARRKALLIERFKRQERFDRGENPDFRADTAAIRQGEWQVAAIPPALLDRRVEITGPAEPKMIINALNSGAKVFMADLEDALCPSWPRVVEGQLALREAARKTLAHAGPEGKQYTLNEKIATLLVRPRGWHLTEKHVTLLGEPISGALFDFGMFFFHNAEHMAKEGSGPFFYLPKLESMEEAALWADVFAFSEGKLGIPHGAIRATVLIETITAAFEMEEILHALKDYCAGLNCGRWDYIFSFIKKFSSRPECMLPDRAQVTMNAPFLTAYYTLLIKTCHKRGAFAMGGMAAQIPVKNDAAANEKAFAAVKADKEREAAAGHDGTWVAHPGLVPVAMEVFERVLGGRPNQLGKQRDDVEVTAAELIAVPEGTITEGGVRGNISVALQYVAAWLGGSGAVPINNLMEDAATAEIARAQLWQWIAHKAVLAEGPAMTVALFERWLAEELTRLEESPAIPKEHLLGAGVLLKDLVQDATFQPFLTEPAYERLE